ncbi:MAG: YopX family protein [Marinomonas gallaica]
MSNRDIKFRAWCSVSGSYDYFSVQEALLMDVSKIGEKAINEDFSFEQFTGKYSESGEVWEGDIYWNGDEDFYPTVVEYDEKEAKFFLRMPDGLTDEFYALEYGNYKLVGNRHQNPELLEQEQ